MNTHLVRMMTSISLCIVSVFSYAEDVSQKRQLIVQQMRVKVDEYTNTILRLTKENEQIAEDKKKLKETLDSITVPDFKVVTNVVRLSAKATRTEIKKIKFKQEARVRKLLKALNDPTIQRLYDKYCDGSCAQLCEEFKAEWKMAEESFQDSKQMMAQNATTYKAEISRIDADAKKQYEDDVREVDARIDALRDERRRVKMTVSQLTRDPPRIREIDREISDLNEKKKMLKKVYDGNKYASSYAAAGDRKNDANDAILAAADLRNQHQNLYMLYNNKLRQDLNGAMVSRMSANKVVVEEKASELNRLNFLINNPDLIKADIVGAILDKQLTEAIGAEFGVDVEEVRLEDQKREAEEFKKKMDKLREEERIEALRSKTRIEEEDAKLAREAARHKMAEEESTRALRAEKAAAEYKSQRRMRDAAEEYAEGLLDEDLQLRKAIRKRIEAESNYINSKVR